MNSKTSHKGGCAAIEESRSSRQMLDALLGYGRDKFWNSNKRNGSEV